MLVLAKVSAERIGLKPVSEVDPGPGLRANSEVVWETILSSLEFVF
jgi:hypothetical protein